jgi:Flp pilus assembly protein CpaB
MSKILLLLFFSACKMAGDAPPPEPELPQVWVPTEQIVPGMAVTRDRLEQRHMAWMHPGIEPLELEEIEGRVARAHLSPGVPVRDERLAPAEAGSTLSAIIPNGMRSVTVPVTTVAGMRAGHYVDVYTNTGGPDLRAITLVTVHPPSADQPPAVTVAVTPQQARVLAVPAARSLALLNPIDITHVTTHGSIVLDDDDVDLPSDPAGSELSYRAVARRDLYPGVTIREEDFIAMPTPGWSQTLTPEEVVGRIPAFRILAGEAVQSSYLAYPGEGIGLASILPRGMRAIFLPVSQVQRLGIKPSDYVDIFAHVGGEPVLLTQAVFVMANQPATDIGPAQLGLLVGSAQAKTLLHTGHAPETRFLAALRNPDDVQWLDMPEDEEAEKEPHDRGSNRPGQPSKE